MKAERLYRFTRRIALIGGFAIVAVSAVTVVSVAGRYAFGVPITGDYELVEYGVSIAAFFFFAFAHASDSHLVAEFFSSRMPPRARIAIDSVQNLILFLILAIIVWRVAIGGIDKFETGDESMFLAMKTWWLHAVGAVGLTLFALVALCKAFARR